MAVNKIAIPSFEFSAFYYGQILEALFIFKREHLPELTDESEFEPFTQFLRAVALVGHLNNVLIDMIANECTLPTAQLPETIRNMLRLIGYELRPATPAQSDVILQLSKVLTLSTTIVPELGQFATKQAGSVPAIYYESIDEVNCERTDRVGFVYSYNPSDDTYANYTTQANTIGGGGYAPWNPEQPGNILYIGHSSIMWDTFVIEIIANNGPTDIMSIEYYDGDFQDVTPISATNIGGGQLQFDCNSLLGTNNRAGATIRIQLHSTGAYQDVVSTWDGTKNIAVSGLLGQSVPSVLAFDYGIGSNWREIKYAMKIVGTDAIFSYDLPQSESSNWKTTTINGSTGYYIRLRIVAATGVPQISDTFGRIRIDTGKQYALTLITQGKSATGEVIGSSNGAPNQRFPVSQKSFILNSQTIFVDGVEWLAQINLLGSGPQDKHYRIELGEENKGIIVFGDGKNGAIPPLGQSNIVANYRFGADDNGNVGAMTIVIDKTGFSYVEKFWNPRKAVGWAEAQSSSDAGLAAAKQLGPATLRNKDVALGPDDVIEMTIDFIDSSGARPYGRAFVVEEGFGPKTLELVVVPRGGGSASSIQLQTLTTYFNGDKLSIPPKRKRIVSNQQVTATNFSQRGIDIDATIWAPPDLTPQQIINQLTQILQPEALSDDGITYLWSFGGTISESFVAHEIHKVDQRITKVVLNGWVDVDMAPRELPIVGLLNITITQ